MTKDFCDKCLKEIKGRKYVRLTLYTPYSFNNGPEWGDANITFCESCCKKVEKDVRKIIPTKKESKATVSTV